MMPSNLSVELSLKAAQDVADILQYTLTNWGLEKRDDYAREFQAAFDRIGRFPEIGEVLDGLPGGRTFRIKEHIAVYQIRGATAFVVRVLHRRMRIEDHLT